MSAIALRSSTMQLPVLTSSVVRISVSAIAKSAGGGIWIVVVTDVPPMAVGCDIADAANDMSITAMRFFKPAFAAANAVKANSETSKSIQHDRRIGLPSVLMFRNCKSPHAAERYNEPFHRHGPNACCDR